MNLRGVFANLAFFVDIPLLADLLCRNREEGVASSSGLYTSDELLEKLAARIMASPR